MALDLPDYEPAFAAAIEQFWYDRAGQMARQRAKGLTDAGTRGRLPAARIFTQYETSSAR